MLGLPQPSIARIETGVVSPTLGMLERICDALGLEMLVQRQRVIPRRVNFVVDMHGCPNRCLHCWLGDLPNAILNDDEAEWIASLSSRRRHYGHKGPCRQAGGQTRLYKQRYL